MTRARRPAGWTRREWLYGQVADWLLVRCGWLAERRGDLHEMQHLAAQAAAGDTSPESHTSGCIAPAVLHVAKVVRAGDRSQQ